jgi:hypothetical protein
LDNDFHPRGMVSVEIAELLAKQMAEEQYKRYTPSYLSMMTDKVKPGGKLKLSNNSRGLLRDEKRMRKLFAKTGQ